MNPFSKKADADSITNVRHPKEPDAEQKLEKSVYTILGLVSFGAIAAGAFIHPQEPGSNYFISVLTVFISEVGVAGVIALVLISSIEKFTKSKHQRSADKQIKAIKENLFYAIYQRHIPPEVFEEVERCLLMTNIVRREYRVHYSLSPITPKDVEGKNVSDEDVSQHLFCSIYTSYVLHNITGNPTEAPVELFLEKPIDETMHQFVRIESVKIGNNEEITEGKEPEIVSTSQIGIRRSTTIAPNGHVKITVKGRTIKRKTDMEVWSSRIPSDGITVQVSAPECIQVEANANHSRTLSHEMIDHGKTHVWELRHGIFPFQSVIFWWKTN